MPLGNNSHGAIQPDRDGLQVPGLTLRPGPWSDRAGNWGQCSLLNYRWYWTTCRRTKEMLNVLGQQSPTETVQGDKTHFLTCSFH